MILVALPHSSTRLEYWAMSLPFSFLKQCCFSLCKVAVHYHVPEKLTAIMSPDKADLHGVK